MEFNYDFEEEQSLPERLKEIGADAICKAISEENRHLYERAIEDETLLPAVLLVNPKHKTLCKEITEELQIKFVYDYNVPEGKVLQITDKEIMKNILRRIVND